jgi:hypothetical protein
MNGSRSKHKLNFEKDFERVLRESSNQIGRGSLSEEDFSEFGKSGVKQNVRDFNEELKKMPFSGKQKNRLRFIMRCCLTNGWDSKRCGMERQELVDFLDEALKE